MIHLVDTSVWIDFLNGADRPARHALRRLIADSPESLAICAPIRMELRMGGNDIARRRLEAVVDGLVDLAVEPTDYDTAADVFRAVRASGHGVRSSIDCLIAAVAERHGARLVHADVGYVRIAAVVPSLDTLDVRSEAHARS